MEEFFKTPTQEEIDRQWLTQLCYDGDMADDEIEEFVDAVLQWKNKAVQCALSNVVEQSEQLVCECSPKTRFFNLKTGRCLECNKEILEVN